MNRGHVISVRLPTGNRRWAIANRIALHTRTACPTPLLGRWGIAVARAMGSGGARLEHDVDRGRRDYVRQFQSRTRKERAVLLGGTFLTSVHHEHVKIEQWRDRWRSVIDDQHLDYDDATVVAQRLAHIAENLHALIVAPFVKDMLQ